MRVRALGAELREDRSGPRGLSRTAGALPVAGRERAEQPQPRLAQARRLRGRARARPDEPLRLPARDGLPEAGPGRPSRRSDGAITFTTADLDVAVNTRTGPARPLPRRRASTSSAGRVRAPRHQGQRRPLGHEGPELPEARGRVSRLRTPEEAARFSGIREGALPPVRVIEDGEVRTVVEADPVLRRLAHRPALQAAQARYRGRDRGPRPLERKGPRAQARACEPTLRRAALHRPGRLRRRRAARRTATRPWPRNGSPSSRKRTAPP